jgi:sugar/nucleoside kinase (ribokinase family)
MSGPELVAFGSLTLDNVVTANGVIMPQYFGGNAVYSALGVRVWSDSVGIVSRCGEGYPTECFDLLQSLGIDTAGITKVYGPHRLNVAFAYQADGSRTRIIPRHLLDAMSETDRKRFYDTSSQPDGHLLLKEFGPDGDDMPDSWWAGVQGIHCPSMPIARLQHIAATARARAEGRGVRVQVDSPWHDNHASRALDPSELLRVIDLLLPSEQDLENYRPGVDRDSVCRDLLSQGAADVVMKRGPNGCRIFQMGRGVIAEVPVVPVDAVDPTGAGDSFCGGFLAGFQRTGDLRMAAHFGAVSASFCVQGQGLEGLVKVDRGEAEDRLASLSRRTGIEIKTLQAGTRTC